MPQRDQAPAGAPCWIDLVSSDLDRAQDFYGRLFGWTSEAGGPEFGGYVSFTKDDVGVAGAMPKTPDMGEMPDVWSIYLSVDDADATVEAAVGQGGQVVVPPMDITTIGRMAVVLDAGGATIGMWQPGDFHGFGVLAEPNTPGWFELFTRDFEKTVTFYESVFGWNTHVAGDSDDFRYTTLGEGEAALAGVMDASGFLPDGVPAHWSVYFSVEDTDATLRQVEELGGAVVIPTEDTPYGRLATAADPTGAMFKLMG